VTRYENAETKSRAALRDQILRQTSNENATELNEKLKRDYGEHAFSRAQVFRWQKAFWMAVRVWKTLHVKNGRKCDRSEGFREV
jgi:hypothetical protein